MYKSSAFKVHWDNLCLELKDGKSFRIDTGPFSYIGDELTIYYNAFCLPSGR